MCGGSGPHGDQIPAEASVSPADITARLDSGVWTIDRADDLVRAVTGPAGQQVLLNDVVVRARRR
jgi:hypothetical protein